MEKVRYIYLLTVSVSTEDAEGLWVLLGGDTLDSVPLNVLTTSFLKTKVFLFNVVKTITPDFLAQ